MSIYFGSITQIQKQIAKISDNEKINHILIVASGVNFMDLTGADALVSENNRLKQSGGGLYFVGLKSSVYEFAAKSCFIKQIGSDHFFDNKRKAIAEIYKKLNRDTCSTCNALVFIECK